MSWVETAKVGDQVVCIKDDHNDENIYGYRLISGPEMPKSGLNYTIAAIVIGDLSGMPGIMLKEIGDHHAMLIKAGEIYTANILYDPNCFRPLITRKTDISMFTSMLNPARVSEDA